MSTLADFSGNDIICNSLQVGVASGKSSGNLVSAGVSSFTASTIDLVGDSRSSQQGTSYTTINGQFTPFAKTSQGWLPVAAALANQRYIFGQDFGVSGLRSDQYTTPAIMANVLASPSGWVMVGPGGVNDISQSTTGFTNVNGVSVTTANVALVAAQNIVAACNQIVAKGKKVILVAEPGSTTFSTANIASMFELNQRLWAYAQATPDVYYWSYADAVYNANSSGTAIAFKTNFSVDGTHLSTQGSFAAAASFNTAFQNFFSPIDYAIDNIADTNTTNPRQLIVNPLFTTLTGGANTNITLTSGTVPSGWTIFSTNASTAVTITSAAEANGNGNAITLALTTTGADTVRFYPTAVANSLWTLNDTFQAGMNVTVASGASNANLYMSCEAVTNVGNNQQFDLYSGFTSNGAFPATAQTLQLLTLPRPVLPGSTSQSFIIPARLYVPFSAAGSMTVTLSRAFCNRTFSYNTSSSTWNG